MDLGRFFNRWRLRRPFERTPSTGGETMMTIRQLIDFVAYLDSLDEGEEEEVRS